MSRKEVPRAGLVKAALAGRITTQQGATALRLSVRQFQRLKRFLRLVSEVLRAVEAGAFHPVIGWHCQSCPYQGRCWAWG